jgi:hypothetical protein
MIPGPRSSPANALRFCCASQCGQA